MFKRRRPEGLPGSEAPLADEAGALAEAPEGDVDQADAGRPPPRPADTGLGVPPYHPAPSKEAPFMGRTPFPTPSPTAAVPSPPPSTSPPPPMSQSMPQSMSSSTPRPGVMPSRPGRDTSERRTLVVGRGISVQGTVQDAERLVVEGTVEASMIHAAELSIAPGGVFKGEVEVEEAEIAGTIDGTLTARGNLIVRATGKVLGTARCRRLQVEDGGQITGRIEMITEGASRAEALREAETVA